MLGAVAQGLVSFLPYRNVLLVAPVALIIGYKAVVAFLQTVGVLRNPYMDRSIAERTAILYADEHGNYETPGGGEVCAIMLAAISNHPLGMFAHGYKEVGDRFSVSILHARYGSSLTVLQDMTKELDKSPTEFGYLGSSTWINSSDRGSKNEQMVMMYFKSMHYLHEYAHGRLHTDTMLWWRHNEHKMKHIGTLRIQAENVFQDIIS